MDKKMLEIPGTILAWFSLLLVVVAFLLFAVDRSDFSTYVSATVVMLLIVAYFFGVYGGAKMGLPKPLDPDLGKRITTLSQQLGNAIKAISEIENDVNARQRLVDQLESQRKLAEAAITLSKPQVDAVAQLLDIQLRKSDRGSAFRDYFLFGAGVFATIIVTIIVTVVLRIIGFE